jgi:hypothetical protein
VIETSVHVPTRSSAVACASASSLGRKTPKISADAVNGRQNEAVHGSPSGVGGYSLALGMERALRLEEHITIPPTVIYSLADLYAPLFFGVSVGVTALGDGMQEG